MHVPRASHVDGLSPVAAVLEAIPKSGAACHASPMLFRPIVTCKSMEASKGSDIRLRMDSIGGNCALTNLAETLGTNSFTAPDFALGAWKS